MTLLRLSCGAALVVALGCSNVSHDSDGAGGRGGAGGHAPVGDTDAAAGAAGTPTSDAGTPTSDASDGSVDAAATDGPSATGWPFVGRRSYVVTSTLTPVGDAGRYGPASHTFTLVIDADTQTAIVGSKQVSFTVNSAGALRFQGQIGFGTWTSGGWSVTYADGLTVVLAADGTLTGTGQGTGTTLYSDTGQSGPVTASLVGGPDTVAPVLSVAVDGPTDDPFSSLTVSASEALPLGATPRLVGTGGFEAAFSAATSNGDFTTSFYGPAVFRWYDRTYNVAVDGIADFAGHPATATGATSFTTRAAPPLIPEDGFESATGTTLGGAQILSGAGAPTITGAGSLYIPAISSIGPASARTRITRLALRPPVAPGDTVVRFAYRFVSVTGGLSFTLACEGGKTSFKSISASGTPSTTVTLPGGSQVQVGPIATAEIPLPADVGSEVVFTEQVPSSPGGLPAPPVSGFIIDDLRAEP